MPYGKTDELAEENLLNITSSEPIWKQYFLR
jgi:hypothetical protein